MVTYNLITLIFLRLKNPQFFFKTTQIFSWKLRSFSFVKHGGGLHVPSLVLKISHILVDIQGFAYYKKKESQAKTYWVCTQYKNGCPGRGNLLKDSKEEKSKIKMLEINEINNICKQYSVLDRKTYVEIICAKLD